MESQKKIEYQDKLRFELFKRLQELDIPDETMARKADAINSKIKESFINIYSNENNRRTCGNYLLCEKLRSFIKKSSSTFTLDSSFNIDLRTVQDFLLGIKSPHSDKLDKFAILCEYFGFKHFCKQIVNVKTSNSINSPLENSYLKSFFKTPCYIMAYDEDIVRSSSVDYRPKVDFPRFDILVLNLDLNSSYFTLQAPDNNRSHRIGEISWCKNYSADNNAFDIKFLESKTDLILRFHFPYEDYEEVNEFNLLCGSFMFARKKGHVAVGTVIAFKPKINNKKIVPAIYSFAPDAINPIEVPDSICQYLYDRKMNWIKIPYNNYSLDVFNKWITKKYESNYIYERVKENEFLILYPRDSISEEDRRNLKIRMKIFLNNPSSCITPDSFENQEDQIDFEKFVQAKFKGNRIKVLSENLNPQSLNESFLKLLAKSVNIIFIIPNVKSNQLSSIHLGIGQSIAMRKNTFVFCDKEVKGVQPRYIQNSEQKVRLFVYEYEELNEVPITFFTYSIKDKYLEWRERKSAK